MTLSMPAKPQPSGDEPRRTTPGDQPRRTTPPGHQPRRRTPREVARAATLAEAKDIALRQLAEGGVGAISLKAIAVELGLTGPAIYRYFASRNDRLTELIVDAYDDLATAIAVAAGQADGSARERRPAVAQAYRAWALAQPHRYRLLYTAPFPGYDPNVPQLVDAARKGMASVLDAWAEDGDASLEPPLDSALAQQLEAWAARHDRDDPPERSYRAVVVWARLHGLVLLELDGVYASMGVDADAVFAREIDILVAA